MVSVVVHLSPVNNLKESLTLLLLKLPLHFILVLVELCDTSGPDFPVLQALPKYLARQRF